MTGRLPRLGGGGVAVVDTADQGYFCGGIVTASLALGVQEVTNIADRVHLFGFVLPFRAVVRKVATEVTTLEAASLYSVGIYNADGTSLLVDSGTFNGATTGIKQNTVTAVTLEPGPYLFAQTANTTTTLVVRIFAVGTALQGLVNGTDITTFSIAANTSSAGVLPATTGALTRNTDRQLTAAIFAP